MNKPVYKHENNLFLIAALLSVIVWGGAIFATKGIILVFIPFLFLGYVLAQSGLISYLKGTGALVSESQFPDIQERVKSCAQKIGLKSEPRVFILHGNGMFNAFATKFLRKTYIVLLSDVLDAVEDEPDIINFYIGHEMGHLDRNHLFYEPLLAPALALPLLGAGYSRSREYTCDLYGAACCTPEAAQKGLALLSVGAKRYKTVNMEALVAQTKDTKGFWMSFHELVASYPWLIKRIARISPQSERAVPSRNVLAYLLAIFVPRLNFTSLALIYLVIIAIAMNAEKKGGHPFAAFEKDLSHAEQNFEHEYDDYAQSSEGNPGDADQSDAEIKAEMLKAMLDEVNSDIPSQVEENLILERALIEGDDTLVYEYTVKNAGLEFFTSEKDIYEGNVRNYWCSDDSDVALVRSYGINVRYRYYDESKNKVADFSIITAECK